MEIELKELSERLFFLQNLSGDFFYKFYIPIDTKGDKETFRIALTTICSRVARNLFRAGDHNSQVHIIDG